ncbi:beta-ketoacyl-[acyl-carrier-protein] synthase family protein [Streptomyces olivochromogenes]|uniref:beta-ketoacyl-[acyl-carrier-protein] synthase family protein n=1 Tax=Streptomyces olivochromogenes TaxID=1963 RepID=UPI001F2B2013|nr:beta-ketoacyl-[acyl-carrier-protein] synthase family protein [Streptomyces olivochromogenes]MCF3131690.1 beta-ketoacyl-[acyl-carrier-protein] synthase family protein [Streptomyces olivochromogenes]
MTDGRPAGPGCPVSEDREVVVTGLGTSSPVGGDAPATWNALLSGVSGVRGIKEAWADVLPVRIAAPVAVEPAERLATYETRRLGRVQQLALLAAREAWQDAGAPETPPERLAVAVSSGGGGVGSLLDQYDVLRERGWQRLSPLTLPMYMANGPAAWISVEFGAAAELHAPASACASGADALARGRELIRSGQADVVLAGGADAMIHPVIVAGFAAMRALSRRNEDPEGACRPFDAGRDGFVLGEGAGVMVLEAAGHAARRGARVYAELAGAGRSADAYHIANPDPSGAGAARAMRRALADAGVKPGEIAHVNVHATGTTLGDAAEAVALRQVLGPGLCGASVAATKSLTGHLLGAAGAVEAVITALTLHHGVVPPAVNLDEPDASIGDDVLRAVVRGGPGVLPEGAAAALSNSFAFGGQNVSLVLRRRS